MSNIAALKLGNPIERLAKVLKDNQDKLNLNKDGFVCVDLSNEDALKAIKDQMDKLESIKPYTVKTKYYSRYRQK
ncbi:MAG: multidrug ABC transporter ATPase [Enterobacteriaceae bacterium]|nr:multidrug ABC transporter ATPase [Enterobacteriaceae bacterium]